MKIAIVELMPYPYTKGGGKTHISNLALALMRKGHEVYIITSKKNAPELPHPPEVKSINVGLPHKDFGRYNGILRIYEYIYRLIFEISFVISANRMIKKINPDIIDAQSLITTSLPCSLSKISFVATAHGIYELGFKKLYNKKNEKFVSKILINIYKIIEKFNIKRCKKIISQGPSTLEYYATLAKSKSKTKLIPNLVDTTMLKPNYKKQNKTIVCMARFTYQKGVDKLIKAMEKLLDYKLWLIGEGELESHLKKIAGKNCFFFTMSNLKHYFNLLKKAQFSVLPSEFEGLPYAILEAMSLGTIPVVTRVGELPQLIKDKKNGFFLDSNKPEDIIKKIREIEKYDLLPIAKAARKTIEDEYDSSKVADQFLEVYREAIETKNKNFKPSNSL